MIDGVRDSKWAGAVRPLQRICEVLKPGCPLGLGPESSESISDIEARSRDRYRRALLTSISAVGVRATTVIASMIVLPLIVNNLGAERYGMWATIASFSALIQFSDLGMANGLMNAVAYHSTKNEFALLTQTISSTFFMLLAIALSIASVVSLATPFINWTSFFNLHTAQAAREAGPTVATFATLFALSIPFAVAQRVQLGLQQGYISNLWQIAGIVISFAGTLLAIYYRYGTLLIVASSVGGPLIASVCNHATYFRTSPTLAPRLREVRRALSLTLARNGCGFLAVQLSSLIITLSDNIIISSRLGIEAVTAQSIPVKLVSIGSMLPMLLVVPLWTAYGEASARADFEWIRKTLRRSYLVAGGAATAITLGAVIGGKQIILHWIGPDYIPSTALLIGVALASFFVSLNAADSVFLLGTGRLRFTLYSTSAMLVLSVFAKFYLVESFGLPTIGWLTAISQLLFVNIPTRIYVHRLLPTQRPKPII